MRVMIGHDDIPCLLVDMINTELPQTFNVVNGSWEGILHANGEITINHPREPQSTYGADYKIICTNQDRLRCGYRDYDEVFINYENPNYVAPKSKPVYFDDMGDDIPF